MTLESRLRNGDSAIKLHSIFFPITNVLKNSLHCDEDYDLETVIRPNIHIELDGFKFLVMPLVVICSDFTGDAIVAKHAELTVDDCKFDFPCDLAVFQKEIECLIKKPKFGSALYRLVYQNLNLFRFDEQVNFDIYRGLVDLITPIMTQKIKCGTQYGKECC